jgi:hypothetical protein
MYAINSSGTPALRKNTSEIFPFDLQIVSIPIVDGPSCRTASSPALCLNQRSQTTRNLWLNR